MPRVNAVGAAIIPSAFRAGRPRRRAGPQAPSGIPLGSSVLIKRRVANVVPSECGGEENEQVECIVTDVFLRRLIIDLHSLNLVLIALRADAFFWVIGEIGCSCNLDRAVFWLFGDTDIDIAAGGAAMMFALPSAQPTTNSASSLVSWAGQGGPRKKSAAARKSASFPRQVRMRTSEPKPH
jgi:hypothetical protein